MGLLQGGKFLIAARFGHDLHGIGFQQAQQVIDIGNVLGRHLGHIGATAHLHGDQALGGQHLQGLAQRGAADAVFLGNLQFVDPVTGRQLVLEDAQAQLLCNLFVESAGSEGVCRHVARIVSAKIF